MGDIDVFLEPVPPEQLTQYLVDTIESYNLPANVATMLLASLPQLRALLAGDTPHDDSAGCGQLTGFVSRVNVQEMRRQLSPTQANELRGLAANLEAALGCP